MKTPLQKPSEPKKPDLDYVPDEEKPAPGSR